MNSHMDDTPVGGSRPPDGEEPGAFLDRLLARADNLNDRGGQGDRADTGERGGDQDRGRSRGAGDADGFAVLDAALLARLGCALMHWTELHAMRQRKGPPRAIGHRTFRHIFLLADGGHAILWEVEHNTGADGRTRFRLYADQAAADGYVRERFGEPPVLDLWPGFSAILGGFGLPGSQPGWESGLGLGLTPGFDPRSDPDFVSGSAAALDPDEDAGSELGRLIADMFFSARRAEQHRGRRIRQVHHDYEADNSADHAWRVLRRAENTDRPGDPVRRLLRSAVGHETTLVTLRHDTVSDCVMEWSLYEHAFLLADGAEISLWELEHTLTPDGRPVCEVYLDEATARDSVDRHRAGS